MQWFSDARLLAWVSWEYEEEQWEEGLISETAGQ
jgi:hypothetical protein